jgi:hypothetical protein
MALMFTGRPRFCCRADCVAAKEGGCGGGATLATMGALMARAGGRETGAPPAMGAMACRTGATEGATVIVLLRIWPT